MLLVSIPALDIWQGLLKAIELIYCFIKGDTPTLKFVSRQECNRSYKCTCSRSISSRIMDLGFWSSSNHLQSTFLVQLAFYGIFYRHSGQQETHIIQERPRKDVQAHGGEVLKNTKDRVYRIRGASTLFNYKMFLLPLTYFMLF